MLFSRTFSSKANFYSVSCDKFITNTHVMDRAHNWHFARIH